MDLLQRATHLVRKRGVAGLVRSLPQRPEAAQDRGGRERLLGIRVRRPAAPDLGDLPVAHLRLARHDLALLIGIEPRDLRPRRDRYVALLYRLNEFGHALVEDALRLVGSTRAHVEELCRLLDRTTLLRFR